MGRRLRAARRPRATPRPPYFVVYDQPSSPLDHPTDSVDKLLFCADAGIPVIYSPAPLAGGTAPITVAGHVAQGVAESLFGLVLHQLRRPGSPFLTGMGPAVLDMATAQSSYNAPEYLQAYACFVEMARWLDLPNWGYGGTTDAQLVDAQAGMEIAELTLLSMLLGSNLNHDVGYLDFGMTGSLEQIVIVDEYIAMNRRLLGGVEVSDDTLALNVIADIGPGGDALSHRHTAKHLRTGTVAATILNRKGHERWIEDGAPDLREAARRRALQSSTRTSRRRSTRTPRRASTRSSRGSRQMAERPIPARATTASRNASRDSRPSWARRPSCSPGSTASTRRPRSTSPSRPRKGCCRGRTRRTRSTGRPPCGARP